MASDFLYTEDILAKKLNPMLKTDICLEATNQIVPQETE